MSEFRDTRNLYLEAIPSDFEFPLTYEAWLNADDEYKAVLLFVNFFNEIELAWYKQRFSYVQEVEAVETVVEYLIKNVDKIRNDPERFTPNYIYTVASNCIYCLHEPQVAINREKYEVCNEVTVGDDTVNLFDLAPSVDDSPEVKQVKEAIWAVIHKLGPKAEKVVNNLLNPEDSLSASRSKKKGDALADVSVSAKEVDGIMTSLREVLSPYAEYFIPSQETVEGSSPRDNFIREIDSLKDKIARSDSDKVKKESRKALKKMRSELAMYDMFQTGYSA